MSLRQKTNRANQGSIYLHVLATSLLVTMLGLGSLMAVRLQMRSARLSRESAEARLCAQSAVEVGLLSIKQNANWRTTWSNGVWLQSIPLGSGSFTLAGIDPGDGVLSDSAYEPVVLTGTGTRGAACHKTQVTLTPVVKPLAAMGTCLHSSGSICVNGSRKITVVGAPLSANGQLANSGTIDGNAEVYSVSTTGTVTGTLTAPAATKPLPAATLISQYAAKAATVAYSGTIDKAVLGPGCNPWGSTDPNGLYVLDTGGNAITIKNTRIYGTLIIKAGGQSVILDGAMFCQNYRPQFPVLIVDGNLTIKCTSASTTLSEATNAKNYNPTGVPYGGVCDTDAVDTYPNEIRGLIHVSGSFVLQQTAKIVGTVLCGGTVTCDGINTIVYDAGLYSCPPTGYTFVDGMAISPGSWRQTVD
ncbi:MAG: hypothetical protein ACM3VT_11000 [Solirubrobacterales bacterium]